MELNDRVSQIEDELKILKNEVQAVLLDLRESYMSLENPFNLAELAVAAQPIIINNPAPSPAPEPVAPEEPLPPEPVDPLLALEPEAEPLDETESLEDFEDTESEPEPEYQAVAPEDTAHEEVTRAWRPASGTEGNGSSGEGESSPGTMDLTIISTLADWVQDVVRRHGSERAETLLDMSEMMGFVETDLRDVLSKFVFPSSDDFSGKVTTRDYLSALKELDGILGRATKLEIALLSIMCQGADSG